MFTRRAFLGLSATLPLTGVWSLPAFAAAPEVYASDGVAINGYDTVAYFTSSAPVKGDSTHSVLYKGTTWYFANAENRAAFEADPQAYAPQYGGYCAYALSKNAIAKTSPDAWTLHEGKLYLNYDTSVRMIWQQDIQGNVARADANWPAVLSQ